MRVFAIRKRLGVLRWVLATQFGIDPVLTLRAMRSLPRFAKHWMRFRKMHSSPMEAMPCLQDWREQSGSARGEYFWQDLYVAQKIHRAGPVRHIDVGSRVDGFVAHVASFRDLDVIDIRPLSSVIPRVRFLQQDLMAEGIGAAMPADSVSCLHALEHFGLGRYGDPLRHDGYRLGLENLSRLTAPGGRLYLSVPVGRPRVVFNAHRVFDPAEIARLSLDNDLEIEELVVLDGVNPPRVEQAVPQTMARLASADYALGIFTFRKARLDA